jgi:hydrogenase nickel incorporation protein HypB
MERVKLIDVKQSILSENRGLAETLRRSLREKRTFMVNVMASPGAGKTSLIVRTIEEVGGNLRIGVLEGDVESTVDSERIAVLGVPAVQIRTGGFCHLDAAMVEKGLEALDLDRLDLILVENVGNLICPAECDIGAFTNVVILSVPEGDDKPVKYPLIFRVADAVIINKIDYADYADFDLDAVRDRVGLLNPRSHIITLSCRTRQGLQGWIGWLREQVRCFSAG